MQIRDSREIFSIFISYLCGVRRTLTPRGEVFRFRADQAGPRLRCRGRLRPVMPEPDDRPEEALGRLGEELKAFETARARSASSEATRSIAEGYQLVAGLIGGVLGGAGLGWVFDRFAHTSPWGLGIGLAAGAGVSVFMAARTAARMGRQASAKLPPSAVVGDDDED